MLTRAASQANCAVTAYDKQDGDLSASVTVVPTVRCLDTTSGTCVSCSLASLQAGQCFPARWVLFTRLCPLSDVSKAHAGVTIPKLDL